MSWIVLARTRGVRRGALAGHYVGASGDVSLGVGGGAKVLVGGSRRATVLQPVAVVAQVGINLALGVAGLELRFLSSPPKESQIRTAPGRLAAGPPDFPGEQRKAEILRANAMAPKPAV
jgi:hypothetical protein